MIGENELDRLNQYIERSDLAALQREAQRGDSRHNLIIREYMRRFEILRVAVRPWSSMEKKVIWRRRGELSKQSGWLPSLLRNVDWESEARAAVGLVGTVLGLAV